MDITPTGIEGFDEILGGGLKKGWCYLLKGTPGSGKTIFGLQFLLEGVRRGEKCVLLSFDESMEEIELQAEGFGWRLDGIHVIEKLKDLDVLSGGLLFYDFDTKTELSSFIESITKIRELQNVDRVFIDGIGAIRDMTKDPVISRRILASLMCFLNSVGATTIMSCDMTTEYGKEPMSYLMSGEFVLERVEKRDGDVVGVLHALKYRCGRAHLGRHYYEITRNGIVVYPIVPVMEFSKVRRRGLVSTGSSELDEMLGGGIYEGSSVIISGKSGVGKTNVCLQILKENDIRGNVGVLYSFEESEEEIAERFRRLFGYEPKRVLVRNMEQVNLGKFYTTVMRDFKAERPKMIAIDPVNHLSDVSLSPKELLRILRLIRSQVRGRGTILICVSEIGEALDVFRFTGLGISQFADYIISGRFVEIEGELVKTISVIKNRFGDHEKAIRILEIEEGKGLKISEPLKGYTGIMSGVMRRD